MSFQYFLAYANNSFVCSDMYTCEIPVVGKSITGSEVVADAAEREKKLLRKSQLHLFSMEQKLVIASEGEYRAPGNLQIR